MELINRESLLEKIQFRIEPQGIVGETVRDMVEKTREIIMAEPTVDAVEVVHGRWIWKDGCFHCSNCKHTNDHISAYCEGCGAKMNFEKE